jgi:dipeptidyl aminopeptidase/acylaminoacyl peptidase
MNANMMRGMRFVKNRTDRTLLIAGMLLIAASGVQAQDEADSTQIPASAFARLSLLSDVNISPDGKYLAMLTPIDGRSQLYIREVDAVVAPVLVPAVPEVEFRWLRWANNDRLVFATAYLGTRFGTETVETRLFAVNRDGSEFLPLVRPARDRPAGSAIPVDLPPAQVQDDVVDWLPGDPNHILLSVDSNADARNEVRRIDIRNGKYKVVHNGSHGVQYWLADRQSEVRFGYGYTSTEFIYKLKLVNGDWVTTAGGNWPLGQFIPLAFTENPAIAFGSGPNDSGRNVIRKMDLSNGEFLETVFEHDSVDVDDLEYDPVTGIAAGVAYTEHRPSVYYFDETLALLQRSIDAVLKTTNNWMVSMSHDRQRIVVFSMSDVEPGVYYLWDREHKKLDIIGEVQPGLTADVLASVEPVTYAARDGQLIPAYLTLPRDAGRINLPVVVLPHGGPESRDTGVYEFLPQFLASRGYAVMQPNFRGSSGYGEAFAEAGKGQWGGLMQDDVSDAAAWLVEQGIADPERMCIVGWSYGGYAAAMAAVKTPSLFRCAASINGVLDLARQIFEDKEYIGGSIWTKHMGLDGERAKAVSPYNQAEKIVIPMLIIQAKDDARVTSEQGQRMARRLKRLDKPVEYVEIEIGGHSMTNQAARLTILESLESFLAANIGAN